jgi:DNA repair protein RadC
LDQVEAENTQGSPHVEAPLTLMQRLGPEGLSDADLLALVLGAARTSVSTAHAVAEEYPLERLVTLPFDELRRVPGFNERAAASLAAAIELSKRGLDRGLGGRPKISHPSDVAKILSDIRTERQEHFVCLYLNARTQMTHRATISVGTLDASLVHPREVFAPALDKGATAIILSHNHPSGDPTPSQDDLNLTHRLIEAGIIMGVEIIDHVIVAEEKWVSLKQTGEL